jgi:hypothetical protein
MRATPATPPTTPPAMAPVFDLEDASDGLVDVCVVDVEDVELVDGVDVDVTDEVDVATDAATHISTQLKLPDALQPYPSPRRQPAAKSQTYQRYTPAPRTHHCANSSQRLLSHSHSKNTHTNCTNPTSRWRISVSPQAAVCSSRRTDSSSRCTGLDSTSPRGNRLERGGPWHRSPPLWRDRCRSCEARTQRDRLVETLTVDCT